MAKRIHKLKTPTGGAGGNERRANFLWPHKQYSVEEAGYEFANARTEGYRKIVWRVLLARIKAKVGVSDPAHKTHEIHEKRDGRVRSNPWFERPANDLQTIGKKNEISIDVAATSCRLVT